MSHSAADIIDLTVDYRFNELKISDQWMILLTVLYLSVHLRYRLSS
jgi:hypothetical protein